MHIISYMHTHVHVGCDDPVPYQYLGAGMTYKNAFKKQVIINVHVCALEKRATHSSSFWI